MSRSTAMLVLTISSLWVAGCGSDRTDEVAPVPSDARSGLAAPPPELGIQLRQQFGPLEPGMEVHYCQYYVLPERAVDVQRFEHTYSFGGHHLVVYPTKKSPQDVVSRAQAFDCNEEPTRAHLGVSYFGAGVSNGYAYPEGVAWRFEANSVVLLEVHMLNLGDTPLSFEGRVNLWYATKPVRDLVGTIFFYDQHIYLEPAGRFSARMQCQVPRDIHVLSLTPHMHVRGRRFASQLVGGDGSMPVTLVGTEDWSELELTNYTPTLEVSAGQHFEISCDYENPDPTPIIEGQSKNKNEMCQLLGSYYPKLDFRFEFCMTGGSGAVFDGDKSCGDTLNCFLGATDPVSAEKCTVQTCARSSEAFNEFYSCLTLQCFFPGPCAADSSSSDCKRCTVESCRSQMQACYATGCE